MFDLGFIRSNTGYFDLVVDLGGLAKLYDQTALIQVIDQQYARLKEQAEATE